MTQTPKLIGIDWGTSSLRAYLLGEAGAVIDRRISPQGIMAIENGAFAAALDEAIAPWRGRTLPVLMSGMIGSRQGWREAPYVACPASLADLAAAVLPASDGVPAIVPGVLQGGALPGVMRGEETQIIGALALSGEARIVLPGTHSKWVTVREGRIERFRTFMTGELFAVLRRHSILGRFASPDDAPAIGASDAFFRGVETVRATADGIGALLFTARSLVLTGQLEPAASLDYLSGLLIGDEIRHAASEAGGIPTLIGEPALSALYRDALRRFDIEAVLADDAASAGLWRIAAAAGLVIAETTEG